MASCDSPQRVDQGRRRSLQAGLAGAAAALTSSQVATPVAAKDLPTPPRVTPFVTALPPTKVKQQVSQPLVPAPGALAVAGEAARDAHQLWDDYPPRKYYELDVGPGQHSFHPELPTQTIWGYDRTFPGPTFVERYGVSIGVRIRNNLVADVQGPGAPQISTHLHNLHAASASDGFPSDFYPRVPGGPGNFRDHHWTNYYAGCLDARYHATFGDPREALGTAWYHDHCLYFTAQNVYRGLAGFYLLFDSVDSGNEMDPSPSALRLPSGVGRYDIPLMFNDPRLDSGGYLRFDQFENDGHLGNVHCVNGKLAPYMRVERRKYRFRMLNACVTRFYEFNLCDAAGNNLPFDYIANDGNLLPAPIRNERKVQLAPAERADIVVDFSKFPLGTRLYIVNRLVQTDGRGPEADLVNTRRADGTLSTPATQLVRFDIDANPLIPDMSRVPDKLRDLPEIPANEVVKERSFEFDRENDVWTVNGKIFDENNSVATVKAGTAEIWRLEGKGSWHHPVHIHMEEGRILTRNGKAPPLHERGRKDVFVLRPGEVVRVYMRFRDFEGKYVMHCHNLTHEDHDMMVRFDVKR